MSDDKQPDSVTDRDGMEYGSTEEMLIVSRTDGLGFCMCGESASALRLVRDYLARIKLQILKSGYAWTDADSPSEWLVMYFADSRGFTEHGGGIRGAWLSQDGELFLSRADGVLPNVEVGK